MSFEFRASTLEDLEEIIDLMRIAFGANQNAPFLDRDLLQWKYFEPGPEWSGSRSYVLRQNSALVAHGCAWPVKLVFNGRSYSALTLVDWAASKTSLSAGFQLVKKIAALADIVISIGGSQATRKIMPRIGFRIVEEESLYARVLRPWRQFRTRPVAVTPREIARLARNAGYSMTPRASTAGWSFRQVTSLDPAFVVESSGSSGPASIHTAEFLNYMSRCPSARIASYELLKQGSVSTAMQLSAS